MKRFRDYDPEQPYLLPPDPMEWLPDGHLAFFIHELVQHLDLSSIYAERWTRFVGQPLRFLKCDMPPHFCLQQELVASPVAVMPG